MARYLVTICKDVEVEGDDPDLAIETAFREICEEWLTPNRVGWGVVADIDTEKLTTPADT